jgi:hypothetical protein
LNAPKAQREVGIFGIGEYIAPFQIYKIRNYQSIVNTLPKFRERFFNDAEITSVDDILLRCIGYYQEIDDRVIKEGKNPFKWFQYGVRFLVGLPFMLLKWFGIISDQTLDQITSNRFFRVLSGLVGLIGFFGSIVTIITGWEAFKNITMALFK